MRALVWLSSVATWSGSATLAARLAFGQAYAEGVLAPPHASPPNPTTGDNVLAFFSKKTPYEFWLTCIIMAFGLIVLGLYLWAIRDIRGRRPEDVGRSLIVITVIIGSLVLITVGYSTEQIAPAFGLFGTIIGYMLGRMNQPAGRNHNGPAATDDPHAG